MGEVVLLPGLDARFWKQMEPDLRAAIAKAGLGDAAADEILNHMRARIIEAGILSEKVRPEEAREVSRAVVLSVYVMVLYAIENYAARRWPGAFPWDADASPQS